GCGVEVIDRSQKPFGLRDDLPRAHPIVCTGGPQILAVDHFGKADDRIERRAQLVDQVAQRFSRQAGAEQTARDPSHIAARHLIEPRPPGRAAITEEAAVARMKERDAGDAPVAGRRSGARDAEAGIAEWRRLLEGAGGLSVSPIFAAANN